MARPFFAVLKKADLVLVVQRVHQRQLSSILASIAAGDAVTRLRAL